MSLKLHEQRLLTANVPGYLHQAAAIISSVGLARYLVQLTPSGSNCLAIFRCDAQEEPLLRAAIRLKLR